MKNRKADNPHADPAVLSYEVFITKDSLKVGVKLLVAYQILDPLMALTMLRDEEGLLRHVENLAVTDMGKAIQQSSSQGTLRLSLLNRVPDLHSYRIPLFLPNDRQEDGGQPLHQPQPHAPLSRYSR